MTRRTAKILRPALEVITGRARWALLLGENEDLLPGLPTGAIDHLLADPPYSDHVHGKQRRMVRGDGGRATDSLPEVRGKGRIGTAELGFEPLSDADRKRCAAEFGRLVSRWVVVFSDVESVGLWRDDLAAAGLPHIRTGAWIKVCGQPQLTGDRPGVGFEALQISHRKGRKRWNGGGLPAVWAYQIATDRNATGARVHPTQKPLDLMMRLVEQFTEPGDIVLDPFAGGGTTGVACLRLGRRFIGIERIPKWHAIASERLAAENEGLTLTAKRNGQMGLFGAA